MTNGLLIEGRNVHVYKYIDAAPFEIVCATDMNLNIIREIIGATTPDSGRNKEFRGRLMETDLTLSGCSTSENDGDVSIFYMIEKIEDTHDLEIVFTDNNGNERSHRQDFIIQNCSLTGPAQGMSGYELVLKGTGPFSATELVDPEIVGDNVISDSYTVSGGVIQDNDWIGLDDANIIEVCREGSEQLSIGLPYSFNSGTGTITPDAGTTIDGQRMFVIWTY